MPQGARPSPDEGRGRAARQNTKALGEGPSPAAGEYLPRCGYWGCSVDPFIQSQSGGVVAPQSPPGTIYNSSPGRSSPREVVQYLARCARSACAARILPLRGRHRGAA